MFDFLTNSDDLAGKVLFLCLTTIISAQVIKFIVLSLLERKPLWKVLITTGGMPSSHTALTTCLVTSLGFFGERYSGYFAVAVVVMIITAHDAMGIRYHSGKQAETINQLVDDIKVIKGGTETSDITAKKLKEELGHKPFEVLGGLIFGFAVAFVGYLLMK